MLKGITWIRLLLLLVSLGATSSLQAAPVEVNFGHSSSSSSAASECEGESCEAASSSEASSLPVGLDVSQVLDVAEVTQSWEAHVNAMLSRFGFDASWSAKAFVSAIAVVISLTLIVLIKLATRRLKRRLANAKTRLRISQKRLGVYHRLANFILITFVLIFTLISLFVVWWGVESDAGFVSTASGWLVSFLSFTIALMLTVAIFELITAALERYFYRLSQRGSPRINTLLPIARNILYGTLLVILGITVISELGVDVTPLLAGAGVIGVAVGFGAQALIKDVLNGFIVIVEDLIQVGDVAAVGGKTGLVEKITLRKVQLRDLDGRVYTVPFSEISVVENYTKEFSYYMFDVGVAYREDPDEVIAVLQEIGEQMQADDEYADLILEPIEVLGVDKFADSAVVIKARIKTRPIKQWLVGREFNRRMKYVFDERNIEIPFPHQTLYFGEDKDGSAPPARLVVDKPVDEAANDTDKAQDDQAPAEQQEGDKPD